MRLINRLRCLFEVNDYSCGLCVIVSPTLFLWQCCHFVFPQKSSECGSAVSTKSSLSDDEDMGWSFSWPPTVWHCFLKGGHTHTHTDTHTYTLWNGQGNNLTSISSAEQLFSASRNSSALPQRPECGVARRWGAGLRRLSWRGAIHISEGIICYRLFAAFKESGLLFEDYRPFCTERSCDYSYQQVSAAIYKPFCRVTALRACSWWNILRSCCPARLSCSWPLTPGCLDTRLWPHAANLITPSTSKTKVGATVTKTMFVP